MTVPRCRGEGLSLKTTSEYADQHINMRVHKRTHFMQIRRLRG